VASKYESRRTTVGGGEQLLVVEEGRARLVSKTKMNRGAQKGGRGEGGALLHDWCNSYWGGGGLKDPKSWAISSQP